MIQYSIPTELLDNPNAINSILRELGVQLISSTHDKAQLKRMLIRIVEERTFAKKNYKKFDTLTSREKEVLTLIARGYNNPQIAKQLFLSRHTIEQHRKNINRKLETNQLTVLIQYAWAFELL